MSASVDTPHPVPVSVRAHAKVNLFLAVGARRTDGYHDVTTVLQALDLADEIAVEPSEAGGTVLERDHTAAIPPEDDLAFRAAEAWRARRAFDGGIRIRVSKRIPVGAGLGGGSADAAGVLAALAVWTGSDADGEDMRAVASSLGADVPFFLGPGTRLMTGRGDEPAADLPTPSLEVALVNPQVAAPTGAVYAKFDRMLAATPEGPEAIIGALRTGSAPAIARHLYNNMTEAGCALVPEIRGALRFLEESPGLLGAAMAGSGSTVFGLFETASSAQAAAREADERGWWSCATTAVARAVDVVVEDRR